MARYFESAAARNQENATQRSLEAATVTFPKITTLVDVFATQIDPATWDTEATPTWVTGRVALDTPTGVGRESIITKTQYDLTESSVYVKVVSASPYASARQTLMSTVLDNGDGVWFGVAEPQGGSALVPGATLYPNTSLYPAS